MTTSEVNGTSPPEPPTLRSSRLRRPIALLTGVVTGRRAKWAVLVAWVLLLMVCGGFAAKIATVQDNDPVSWLPSDSQSTQAIKLAEQHFATKDQATASVVYYRLGGLAHADLTKINADVRSAVGRAPANAAVIVTTPGDPGSRPPAPPAGSQTGTKTGTVAPVQVRLSDDHKAALFNVPVPMAGNDNDVLADGVDDLKKLVTADAAPGLQVRVTGQAGTIADYIDVYSGMDGVLLGVALGIVAVLLLITYRSPILWLVPLVAIVLATQVATAVVYLLAKHADLKVDGQSAYILTVLSLGVGTDYALLLIARYREELREHADRHEAMAGALARSLPAIAASAATVSIALLCLVFGKMNSTQGLGPVVAIGVAVVFAASVTLLPALLVILGRWVFWPVVPHAGDADPAVKRGGGFWARVAGLVDRTPRPVWAASVLVLVALAGASFTLDTGQTQAEQFTKTVDSVAGQELISRHFPAGSSEPADIYVKNPEAAKTLGAVTTLPGIESAAVDRQAGGWSHLTVVLKSAPDTPAARAAITRIRDALEDRALADAVVGGQTAVALDTADAQASEAALLIPVILAVVLVMLMALLRAVAAPLLLLASVVLSYGAALGGAALIFKALGHPRIDRGLLLFGFLFLVALGVDYTIFLMSRAREEVAALGHRPGILRGLTVTGGVITSAGVVLAATFSVLAVVPTVTAMQQGLLIAFGVLLDTFLVRSLLIPALSIDAGPRIWWPARHLNARREHP